MLVNTKSFAIATSPIALNSTVSLNDTLLLNTEPVESTVNKSAILSVCALKVTNVPFAAEMFPVKFAPPKKVNIFVARGVENTPVATVLKKPVPATEKLFAMKAEAKEAFPEKFAVVPVRAPVMLAEPAVKLPVMFAEAIVTFPLNTPVVPNSPLVNARPARDEDPAEKYPLMNAVDADRFPKILAEDIVTFPVNKAVVPDN